MLKKLRIKFILINMTIVTIMLGTIFGLLYYSTSHNLKMESMRVMERITANPERPEPPRKPHNDVNLPYFSITMDRKGEPVATEGNFFDLSDKGQVNSLLAQAKESKKENGELRDYRLRFRRSETPDGMRIVFVDMSSEQSMLNNLIRTFSIVGSAAFMVFLGISILLARWAVKPVDMAWQQQKQFVADASHELKTPLTVIMTDAELLQAADCLESDRKTLTDSILTMSSQMRGLVENMLDLARLDNASVKEERKITLLSDTVSEAIMMFETVFFEKDMPLRYEVEPDILANCIESQIKQLISILLDNACKYASPGGETFVKLSRCGHKRCLIEVSNQGEAISENDLKNLFKRFYRADKARTMNHSYGLGLSIAQSITEEHHGKIHCESSEGYNRFFVELPCLE